MRRWSFHRLLRRLGLGREYGRASGNIVSGSARESGRCDIRFGGSGNRVVIGRDVRFKRLEILFTGDGGVVEIGAGCELRGEIRVNRHGHIVIGAGTKFNKDCRIHAGEGREIRIGAGCLFADVGIRTSDAHAILDAATGERLNPAADVVIGDRVWLAERVLVYKGAIVGDDVVVGAGSIVTGTIAAHSLAVGSPARAIRGGIVWREKL